VDVALSGGIFLVVSALALVVQGTSLYRLVHRGRPATPGGRLAYWGLLRTSGLRVVVAVMYVTVGVFSLLRPPTTGTVALLVFAATQLAWTVSGLLDVRLRRQLDQPLRRGRHRRRRR